MTRAARRRTERARNQWWVKANAQALPFRMKIAAALDVKRTALAQRIRGGFRSLRTSVESLASSGVARRHQAR